MRLRRELVRAQKTGAERGRVMSVYKYSVPGPDGEEISLGMYRGKVLLIVNTAAICAFNPHYLELETLYEQYRDRGFEILDIPCDQFTGLKVVSDKELHQFRADKYNIQFSQMATSDVTGEGALPLFAYLNDQKPFEGFGENPSGRFYDYMLEIVERDYHISSQIKWNFTKFLIDREGNVSARFEPSADMADVEAAVCALL